MAVSSTSNDMGGHNCERKYAISVINASADCTLPLYIMSTSLIAFAQYGHICYCKNHLETYFSVEKETPKKQVLVAVVENERIDKDGEILVDAFSTQDTLLL